MIFYIHVGKTGGSAIKRAIRASHAVAKTKEPQVIKDKIVLLNHVSLAQATQQFGAPNGLAFAFRNPLSRFVSGFYCRQRMEWPDHTARWDAGEAAAFAHFDTANDLAEALGSDAPKDRAAAHFAMHAIRHLRRGYRYTFGDLVNFMLNHSHLVRVYIDTTDLTSKGCGFIQRLGGMASDTAFKPAAVSADYPRDLSAQAQQNLRAFWAQEFEFYDAFTALRDELENVAAR